MRCFVRTTLGIIAALALAPSECLAQGYRIERIASGLNQPTYLTQAPGDPANILYFTERTSNTIGGFSVSNQMGKVWRYDVNTRTKSLVLDLSSREVFEDTGLQTIAFPPDFNSVGSFGFQKMYLSASERGNTALNKVEEYTIGANGTATFSKTILQYSNNRQNNHTIDWIGFDPTATGAARNYLYISVGDGSFGNPYNAGTSTTGRPSQNPSDVQGKILRVDVSGPDAYPTNNLKNFAIPADNPIPVYNAAHPTAPIMGTIRTGGNVVPAPALGEVWVTGVRNGYRASFDRATGDFYYGDVGESALEEVNFLKAGSNSSGAPPVDFGWPQKEGSEDSGISGAPHTTTNPFTGVTSLYPIHDYPRSVGQAVMGGSLYRGSIPELQGKYLFSDFVGTGKMFVADFNRNTDPATFDGSNAAVTDVSALWQSLVIDPTDPTYTPDSTTGSSRGLDHILAISEDNAGNVYLVDFGNGAGFNGQYPGAGLGEIFRLTRVLSLKMTVNRDTGAMTIINETDVAFALKGYAVASAAGALISPQFTPVTGNFDAPPGGDGSIDPNDDWQITSPANSRLVFSEASLGDPGALAAGSQLALSASGGWRPSRFEDLTLSLTLADGTTAFGAVEYVGNDGQPFARSDFDANGTIDLADWHVLATNHLTNLDGLTALEQYLRGDLDGNGANNFVDFRLFEGDYDAVNGPGALAEALAEVPEPNGVMLALMAAITFMRPRRRFTVRPRQS